ncbi:SMAD/FHA domain [Pseudocohnilembus persalinus]|uniref:SMAD/FHA domain n=1 Tax=Pseudocohnilembus persalinus TaxID=266149 RepID=A0A0V0R780_PSEPJ|nr:SMAD/FHA domain [Pseudocohnilembus persalinus]|eukprot:KRX10356.1 SMAD/FHA domain [Pseudocohnilembus persalinus]
MSKVNKVIDFKTQQQIFYKHKGNTVVNKQEDRIEGFTGDYFSFLHNDFPSLIRFSNLLFPSISSAFQAARSQSQEEREAIASVDSPEELWDLAVKIEDPEDWEQRKLKVMESLLRDKFRRNKDLKERLMETGNRQLINTYDEETESNLYWGHINGKGQNHLGKLLENIRNDIQRGLDLHKWIFFTFSLERDLNLVPLIKLNVFKDGKQIETLNLEKKNFFIFGTQKTNDVILAHPMISRQHACILCDNEQNIKLIDLGSKGGTYLNDELIEEYTGVDLEFDDVISFSVSTRKYYVEIDYTQVYNSLMKQERDLKRELMLLEKLDNPNISKAELREVLGFSVEDTIYVGNLPFSASISDIKDHFKQYGSVKKVKFLENSIGKSKGVALVTYKTPQQAKTALLKYIPKWEGEN